MRTGVFLTGMLLAAAPPIMAQGPVRYDAMHAEDVRRARRRLRAGRGRVRWAHRVVRHLRWVLVVQQRRVHQRVHADDVRRRWSGLRFDRRRLRGHPRLRRMPVG